MMRLSRLYLILAITALAFAAPCLVFGERPPYLKQETGEVAVYMGVTDLSRPGSTWKGAEPKSNDTHHLLFLFRNARTGRAENINDIKLKVVAPSGKTVADTAVKPFIAKGISTHGSFVHLDEGGNYKATISFAGGTATFSFNK